MMYGDVSPTRDHKVPADYGTATRQSITQQVLLRTTNLAPLHGAATWRIE